MKTHPGSPDKLAERPPPQPLAYNEPMFTVFLDWKRRLLASRGLDKPDGRALYQYRVAEAEFLELEGLLREWLGKLLNRFDLGRITSLSGFPALFVLYAAEWWRRRFDGSHWSWEPILNDLNADPNSWSFSQRSQCVERGLREWRLEPRLTGGLRFLGSVAVQGGLPLKLLAEARGRIGVLLSQVLKQAGGSRVTQHDLLTWVESLHNNLPASYRQPAIFSLLAEVAWTVIQLKEQAGLTPDLEDAIARLDREIPAWRDRFPLPIDDHHARALLEQLVRDAARVKAERPKVTLPIERQLAQNGDGTWSLRASLVLPDTLPSTELAALFGVTPEELPRTGELSLTAGERRHTTTLRRLAGHDGRYRLERKPWGFSGRVAADEQRLSLTAPDGRVWSATAPRGGELDEELPWVFSSAESQYRLLRQGGGSVAPIEALIALPCGWGVEPLDDAQVDRLGLLADLNRTLYRLRGAVSVRDGKGLSCRIRTGQAGANEESYEWHGRRLWLDFRRPHIAFKGQPQLYRVVNDTAKRVEGNPAWSVIGASGPTHGPLIGPLLARYPANGDVKLRSRMVVLPEEAELTFAPHDAQSGTITLEKWGVVGARAVTNGVTLATETLGNSFQLKLSAFGTVPTPETFEVDLFWPHTTSAVRLALPFPAQGVRAFDAAGQELANGSLLAVQKLLGVRLSILRGGYSGRISLELEAPGSRVTRLYPLQPRPESLTLEIRLHDYLTDIQHLLATDDRPDAEVRVVLRIGGVERFHLHIARYAAKLERNGNRITLEPAGARTLAVEAIPELTALALRLEHPGDEAIPLPHCYSEGVPTGAWQFDPDAREPGSWLIYPSADSPLPFRPTLWTIPGDEPEASQLARAIHLSDPENREAALDQVIETIAADFDHPGWMEIEQLAGQVGHLPLVTLDLWRRLARSPQGMAALALRFGTLPGGFLARFAQELPFAWETIPFSAWKQAMQCLLAQCRNRYGADVGGIVFQSHLDARRKDLSAQYGALHYLLGIAAAEYAPPEIEQDLRALRALGTLAAEQLFRGEQSLLQRLFRSHRDDPWPNNAHPILLDARNQPEAAPFLCPDHFDFRDGVINLPLLLAVQVATSKTLQWFGNPHAINLLRSHIAFDPEWFDEAYNLTIARCFAAGVLTPTGAPR